MSGPFVLFVFFVVEGVVDSGTALRSLAIVYASM
jgi:hypothetical protein